MPSQSSRKRPEPVQNHTFRDRINLFIFSESERSAKKLLHSEVLESLKGGASFQQAWDTENITALTTADIAVCFLNALLYFSKWL